MTASVPGSPPVLDVPLLFAVQGKERGLQPCFRGERARGAGDWESGGRAVPASGTPGVEGGGEVAAEPAGAEGWDWDCREWAVLCCRTFFFFFVL